MATNIADQQGLKDVTHGLKVIDCDSHFTEPPDLWTSRAPAKYRDRVPQVRTVDGHDQWFVEGNVDWGQLGATVIDTDGGKYQTITLPKFEQLHRASWDPKARVTFMDEYGIWASVVYPNAAGMSAAKFMSTIKDSELELDCIRTYNDAIAEWQQQSGNRLFPQAMLPMKDLDATLKEMRRATEDLELKGFAISDNLPAQGLPDYNDPHWEPFWELANSLQVPLNFHVGGTLVDAAPAVWKSFGFQERLAISTTLFEMSNAAIIGNFLFSGLFDKYPNLKLVSVESGLGWLPFYLESLEYQLDEMVPTQERKMKRRPKEYFRDHFYVMFWFEDAGPRNLIEQIGVNNVLFETDFPHPTCLYPKNREHLNDVLSGWDDHTLRRVLQDNAVELYRIEI